MSAKVSVTCDGRVAAPVRGVLEEEEPVEELVEDPYGGFIWVQRDSGLGTMLRAMHQHPRSIPLCISHQNNKHAFHR
uniref:Uncharacterized protein n=1 Tax=Vespula pensylvanica TaxID=30213 RepID=A0A834UC81_VESPE|nr:hypothetical protein H0235_006479 [Vespula pensylvanica]